MVYKYNKGKEGNEMVARLRKNRIKVDRGQNGEIYDRGMRADHLSSFPWKSAKESYLAMWEATKHVIEAVSNPAAKKVQEVLERDISKVRYLEIGAGKEHHRITEWEEQSVPSDEIMGIDINYYKSISEDDPYIQSETLIIGDIFKWIYYFENGQLAEIRMDLVWGNLDFYDLEEVKKDFINSLKQKLRENGRIVITDLLTADSEQSNMERIVRYFLESGFKIVNWPHEVFSSTNSFMVRKLLQDQSLGEIIFEKI